MKPAIACAVAACALSACDSVSDITVRFAVSPGGRPAGEARVSLYWVGRYQGKTYVSRPLGKKVTAGPEVVYETRECCGESAAYLSGDLWYLACVTQPGSEPVLVCGKAGEKDAKARGVVPGTTCEAIDARLGTESANVDLTTCTLSPRKL